MTTLMLTVTQMNIFFLGGTPMQVRQVFVACGVALTSIVGLADNASAFCGTVSASGQGNTRQQAVNAANNKGLKETNKLDRNYGGKVNYQLANLNCWQGQNTWNCRISQKFCTK